MEKIANWLRREGFTVNYQARGRNWIAFSGDAAQIRHTFHTEIHQYMTEGERHFANTTNPSIPAALAAVVSGIRGLHDFRLKSARAKGKSIRRNGMRPDYTDSEGGNYLAPTDIATIYNFGTLGSLSGGQTIVVVGQTDFYPSDIAEFRSSFRLPPQLVQSPPCSNGSVCMMLFGTDPGITADVDEAELDLEVSGGVAPNATINYVYSTDVFNSVEYAIDNDLGPVISMSYGGCEQENLGVLAFGESLAQEANGLGITWLAASGDSGAAACDPSTASEATQGLAVSFPASIPEVTAVGGTELMGPGPPYWSSSNQPNGASALSYVPEVAWNDSPFGISHGPYYSGLAAGGGGASIYYPTPAWQTGPGFPNDGFRDVPDVSFSASALSAGYLLCIQECPAYYSVYGGTSASTPVFAGIVALLNQYLMDAGTQHQAGLGNINPTLYALSKVSPYAFHDITKGSNIVPCLSGTPDCNLYELGYSAQPGYDQATGLGSLDVFSMITSWAAPQPPRLKIAKSHSGNFTQGQYAAYTVQVTNAGMGTPSGTVTVTENLPPGLNLGQMKGSGWSCSGNVCTIDGGLLAANWEITVTVGVDSNAPPQVTNQISVSGGDSATAEASDVTTIQPNLANALMSKLTPASGSCTAPASTGRFLPTDPQAGVWFQLNWANEFDRLTANWYGPSGSLYTSYSWPSVATAGPQCFWDAMDIAGSAPAGQPGSWNVAIQLNSAPLFTLHFTIGATAPADFNRDGHPDVIWEEPTVGWAQVWYLGGSQGVSITGAANLTKANPWNIVGVGDFNGDGIPDVVWQDPVSGAVQVWFMGGAGGVTLLSAANITTKNPWRVVSVADFNQDGHPDLLWQDPNSGWAQIWYLGGPQGITLLGAADLTKSNPWRIVGTADFNNDGFPDVLWQDPVSGTVQIWYMGGAAPGAQGSALQSAINLTGAMTTKVVAIADFNNDGHPDVIFQNTTTGAATVYFYTGLQGTIPNGTAVLSTGNPWYIAGPH